MMRSMFSAISGLRAHQNWMDVIGNNIANVNTTGFKVGRVRFQDILNQTVRGASSPTEGRAGTNPIQVGLGSVIGAIDTLHTQGALQSTGRSQDMAIQGEGFFVVSDGNRSAYTRDGGFDIGLDGKLVNAATGMYVMGWQADDTGAVQTSGAIDSISIPLGQKLDATPSTAMAILGNLNAGAAADATSLYEGEVTVVDSLGFEHELTVSFQKTAGNTWSYTYSTTDPAVTLSGTSGTLVFDSEGLLDVGGSTFANLGLTMSNGSNPITITGGGDFTEMTQLASLSTATPVANGSTGGSLMSFTVNDEGQVLGVYSNGTTKVLGQIAVATFQNPGGLMKLGGNMFGTSANSGDPNIGAAGSDGRGTIAAGYLEMSNVDLADQFTSMIMAERGFQANSRVITTSDEILQDLVNLKR